MKDTIYSIMMILAIITLAGAFVSQVILKDVGLTLLFLWSTVISRVSAGFIEDSEND